MSERWFVLLGGNPLHAGFPEIAARFGARLAVVDWNEAPAVAGERHIRLDIKNAGAVLDALTGALDGGLGAIAFAYTSADVAVETAAAVNAAAGRRRADPEALRRAADKAEMNRAWEAAGLLGKRWALCASGEELAAFVRGLDAPGIVKPVSASSSRGVSLLAPGGEGEDLAAVWSRAAACDPLGRVLAEEFVPGTEFTVEMMGDAAGRVRVWGVSKKYHTPWNRRNRVATRLHYNPPDVPDNELHRIAAFAAACYRALGLRSALGHFETILRPDGRLVPVEMGARSSGFIASHLVDGAVGGTGGYLDTYARVLSGDEVEEGMEPARRSSMYFFYDPPPGRWTADGLDLTRFLPGGIRSLAHDRDRLTAGREFAAVDADSERVGFEILVGNRDDLTIDAVRDAERRLHEAALVPGAGP